MEFVVPAVGGGKLCRWPADPPLREEVSLGVGTLVERSPVDRADDLFLLPPRDPVLGVRGGVESVERVEPAAFG